MRLSLGDWSAQSAVSSGIAEITVPADRIYPASAIVELLGDASTVGRARIDPAADLDGLFPGDAWRCSAP